MDKTTLLPGDRIALKDHLMAAGLMDKNDGNVTAAPTSNNSLRMARNVLAQIGLEEPLPGTKIRPIALNEALAKVNLSPVKRIEIKSALAAAGFLD
jgi:hypothetical protein